jgi:Pentapeptide repeats (8 copies)
MWPVVALGVMALSNQYLGLFGILMTTVGSLCAVALLVGAESFPRRLTLAIALGTVAVGSLIIVGRGAGLVDDRPGTRPERTASPTPSATSSSSPVPSILDLIRRGEARGAALGPVGLDRQVLVDARLDGIQAAGASMVETWLNRSSLAGADLRGADMQHAHLREANLRGANLAGADLRRADLTDACLVGSDLTGALLEQTVLSGAVVDGVRVIQSSADLALGWSTPGLGGQATCLRRT